MTNSTLAGRNGAIMRSSRFLFLFGILFALVLSTSASADEDKRFEVGIRTILVTAGGEPHNDMQGVGVFGEYHLAGDKWFVGAAVDSYTSDFERPYLAVGVPLDPSVGVIDGTTDAIFLSGWAGREYGRDGQHLSWFWTAGLGFTSPDDPGSIVGPVEGGGTFDITADPGSETIVSATGGLRKPIGQRWSFQFTVRADHHFADWSVTDRVSGNKGRIDDYTGLGGGFAFGVRF